MKYQYLLTQVSLPYYRKEKVKFFTAVLGMVLGISLYAAIRLANNSAIDSFYASVTRVSGPETIKIEKNSGKIPESMYKELLTIAEIDSVSPLSSQFVSIHERNDTNRQIQIIGIDLFSSAASIFRENSIPRDAILSLFSPPYAGIMVSGKRDRSATPETLTILINGKPIELKVAAISSPRESKPDSLQASSLIVDISIYQELFNEYGVIDAFIITPENTSSSDLLIKKIRAHLGEDYIIQQGTSLSEGARQMSAAFRLNLLFLSGIAVLLAILLIYNLSSYHILKRRKDLGTLLSLGATPFSLFTFLMTEALFIGFLSSIAGVFLGYLFSYISIDLVSKTFSALYYPVDNRSPQLSPSLFLECLGIGILASLAGSLLPAFEIFRITPRESFGYQTYEQKFYRTIPGLTLLAAVCFFASCLISRLEILHYSIYLGFIAPGLLISGSILVCPAFILVFLKTIRRIASRAHLVPLLLAADHMSQTLRRYSIAIASIVVAVAMGLGLSIMVRSFRASVETWITKVTRADLYISTASDLQTRSASRIPDSLIDFLDSKAEVAELDWVQSETITLENKPVKVLGIRFEILKKHSRLLLMETLPYDLDFNELLTEDAALISETASNKHALRPGDKLAIPGIENSNTYTIQGVFKDFSSEQGVIMISDRSFRDLFLHDKKEAVSVYLTENSSPDDLIEKINSAFPEYYFQIRDNKQLRSEVLGIFDQTFLITKGIRAMIGILALFILAMCIRMLLLERRREFSILHAIGAARKTIATSIISEALLIGLFSVIPGLLFGVLLSLYLVFNINTWFFGWSLEYSLSIWELVYASGIVLLCSFLAGILPLLGSSLSFSPGDIRYE